MQDWETAEVFVKRLKSQEVFVTLPCVILCANGTINIFHSHRPLSPAEGNLEQEDDVKIETSVDEESSKKKDS